MKAIGWRWERTQRTEVRRGKRHWLVLMLATLWALAAGTVAEEAQRQGVARALVTHPVTPPAPLTGQRSVRVLQRGRLRLRLRLLAGTLPAPLWLAYEAWPEPPDSMAIVDGDTLEIAT